MHGVAESVVEGLGTELGEHGLHMQVIGAAQLDLSVVVCQAGYQCTRFCSPVPRCLVAAVVAKGMKSICIARGGLSLQANKLPLLKIHNVQRSVDIVLQRLGIAP